MNQPGIADCGFIDSENPVLTASPIARDSSSTINPQSAIHNPQPPLRSLTAAVGVGYCERRKIKPTFSGEDR
jgi:hypothetical protein